MRILVSACAGLAVISCITSAVLWNDLRTERQLITDLRMQLDEAETALAVKPAVSPVNVAAVAPQPSVEVPASSSAPAAAPAKISREAAEAALMEESVKRQKTLLADPEYRAALLARARVELKQHYAGLGVELGLTERESNGLFDLLADAQAGVMASFAARADGAQPDAADLAEMERQMQAQQQQLKASITALLGPERFAQFEEYDRIQPSRTRVTNLGNLLGRSGNPLSNSQVRSLTAIMVTEQKRLEAEAKALSDVGQADKRSPADIQAETNRRILEQVPAFLDDRQVQLVRGRFEQRATIDRSADRLQQREREVLQEGQN